MPNIIAFSDGSCAPNPGPGGWGARLFYGGHKKDISGFGGMDTTNNRMELQAAIEVFKALNKPCHVVLTTDSNYVVKGVNEWAHNWAKNGWKRKRKEDKKMVDIANKDLWIELHKLLAIHTYEFIWIKGHAGFEHNEACDKLANEARIDGLENYSIDKDD